MAKNKKETSVVLAPIDYLMIIDDYNVEAFHLCVEQLFPLFELRVLKEQDIRPIDLKEQVLRLTENLISTDDGQSNNSTLVYCEGLRSYFELMVTTAKDSRAQKYKDRAIELLDQAINGEQLMQNIGDALLIFVALMKPLQRDIKSTNNKCIMEPDFSLSQEDVEIIEKTWAAEIEALNNIKIGFFKKRDNNGVKDHTFFYINNTMLFCRLLQERGAFAPEE